MNLNWLLSTVYISFEIFNFENKVEIDDLEDSNNFKIEIIGHVQLEFNSNISTHFWLRPNSDTLKLTLIYNFKLCGRKWCEINVRISWSDSFSMNTTLQRDNEFLDLVGKKLVVNRNETLLILEATNFELTDQYKILTQPASIKPKENVVRKWYESSKIKITKISFGIWVKSGKARCILNAFTRSHLNQRKMIKDSRNI